MLCAGPPGAAKAVKGDAHIALRKRSEPAKIEPAALGGTKNVKSN